MAHDKASAILGSTVKVKADVPVIGGSEFAVVDWFDRVHGWSWMSPSAADVPAVVGFKKRYGQSPAPHDDDVLYGRINGQGALVHASEIAEPEKDKDEESA